jgi:hypothetical protein
MDNDLLLQQKRSLLCVFVLLHELQRLHSWMQCGVYQPVIEHQCCTHRQVQLGD